MPALHIEQPVFKTPLKRKLLLDHATRQVKKVEKGEPVSDHAENESDFSDCASVNSQGGLAGWGYGVDVVKLFLSVSRNAAAYFSDLDQFAESTKNLMSEGHFTDKEVF